MASNALRTVGSLLILLQVNVAQAESTLTKHDLERVHEGMSLAEAELKLGKPDSPGRWVSEDGYRLELHVTADGSRVEDLALKSQSRHFEDRWSGKRPACPGTLLYERPSYRLTYDGPASGSDLKFSFRSLYCKPNGGTDIYKLNEDLQACVGGYWVSLDRSSKCLTWNFTGCSEPRTSPRCVKDQ